MYICLNPLLKAVIQNGTCRGFYYLGQQYRRSGSFDLNF